MIPSGHRQALLEVPPAPCVVLGSLWEWQGWRVTRKWVESPGHSLGYIGVSLETLERVVRAALPVLTRLSRPCLSTRLAAGSARRATNRTDGASG